MVKTISIDLTPGQRTQLAQTLGVSIDQLTFSADITAAPGGGTTMGKLSISPAGGDLSDLDLDEVAGGVSEHSHDKCP